MSTAFAIPTTTIAATTQASVVVPLPPSMLSMATPTRSTIAIAAAWERTASTVESASEALYGSGSAEAE